MRPSAEAANKVHNGAKYHKNAHSYKREGERSGCRVAKVETRKRQIKVEITYNQIVAKVHPKCEHLD